MLWIEIAVVVCVVLVIMGLRVLQQYQLGLVLRFGRYVRTLQPGLQLIIPFIEALTIVDTRVRTLSLEQQESMTKDNVPVKLLAVVWFKVVDPRKAALDVMNYQSAAEQTSLTALRTVSGQHSLDELLKEQDKLALALKESIDHVTEPWGVQIERVEIKDVQIPETMQRAMAQEAEALREKRARIIKAEAELDAARKLAEAAEVVARYPAALELRRMQMLTEVGAEQNTMTVVMLPSQFLDAAAAIGRMVPAEVASKE
jgi:regulator of protease activity HflC (stomatin/prohibitin superfamily)